jgi:mono/diheme cytochrome c family protein
MSRAVRVAMIAMAAGLAAGGALAQDAAKTPPIDGKALFHEKCAMCHGPGGMGTGLLVRRVQPGELEKRDNLNAAYVFQYARRGLGNMPPITPGEVSDPELRAVADYLAAGARGRK